MGFAKYYEDDNEIWTERMTLRNSTFKPVDEVQNKRAQLSVKDARTEKRIAFQPFRNNHTPHNIPFTIRNNEVRIKTNNSKLFWALKESLKEYGGRYNSLTKSWSLTNIDLHKWLNKQASFGWTWQKNNN